MRGCGRGMGRVNGWLALALIALLSVDARGQVFSKHVVVSQEGHASDIGRDVMRNGGNAFDAAVATAFALAVTHPAAGNLGGGGFLVAYRAEGREVLTFDFREMAPQAADSKMYLGPDGKPVPHHRAGAKAAGVPATVRGLGLIHARIGKSPWADLVRPAARLAREGFPVSETLAKSLNQQLFKQGRLEVGGKDDLGPGSDRLADFPESVEAFAKPDRTPWQAGERLIQRDLADTLDRIANEGPDEFYTGRTAQLLTKYMAEHGGLVTLDDLKAYQAKERSPIHSTFRGFDVYGMGPSASGGILLAEMLNILERFDLKADGPRSPRTLHRVTEAMRRGFFTRATEIADPEFVNVPVAKLISKAYADELARSITDRATPSAELAPFPVLTAEGSDTTHLSTIDGDGNAAALTYTLEEGYGSKAVVAGAGFLLNNEMGDFNIVPGRTDSLGRIGTAPNLIEPRKRMLSSQTPTIVLKKGRVQLVTGSPGGRTIPNTVLWVVLNNLEFQLEPRESVDAVRTHHAWFPDVVALEGKGWPQETREALEKMGYRLRFGGIQGDAHTIVVDPETGRRHGVADRRRETSRASGD
ncbi:gamma-glutamyltranspeptidase [Singulisphaera acidiphila DSM 18658]|uniref:Glutathione hydrolase proenzyme n=2 Tax=Singulisphaera acidiphila TaxID=466153 RepID=L0DNU4_SINAD|nr:gamma-glutamyltranspeptidase [Singulisphaera acidiphila DSM 18658]